ALMIARRLDEIDPYFLNSRMIIALYYNKKYDEAVDFAESRIKVFNNYYTLDNYGFLMLNTGDYPRAIELFQQVMNIEGIRYPRILGWMGATYAHSGQKNKARELIDELEEKLATNDAGSIRFFMAVIYSALGDKDTALQWLQAAYEEHEMEMPWLISEPQFYNLHSEPEFQQLVAAMGFPAYSAE
ncbi:MAG: tetratricopeptide repeat protein, partial [Cyclobacteriaceae bacterium]